MTFPEKFFDQSYRNLWREINKAGRWDSFIRSEIKNISGKQSFSAKNKVGKESIPKNWGNVTESFKTKLRTYYGKKVRSPWNNLLRSEARRVIAYYSNRGISTRSANHRYSKEDYEWREFFNYWGSRLGEVKKFSSGWDKFILHSKLGLQGRVYVQKNRIKTNYTWAQLVHVRRKSIHTKQRRFDDPWYMHLCNSSSYLRHREKCREIRNGN